MSRRAQAVYYFAWLVAIGVTVALAVTRYRAGVRDGIGGDFGVFFLPAAREIAQGHSPYLTAGYRYPPIIALVLAPFVHVARGDVWRAWTALAVAAAVIAVAVFVRSEAPRLSPWRRPVLAAFCGVTCLHFWPLVVGLFFGALDTLVLLALILSTCVSTSRGRGALIGVAGMIKTWPVAVGVALFQRGVESRRAAIGAFVLTFLIAPLSALAFGWRLGFVRFLENIFASQGNYVSDSVWGIPRLLFTNSGLARPVTVSATLDILVAAALALAIVGLLVIAIRPRGDAGLCTWNVMFCVVLLLPGSHLAYTLYALPVLWTWGARCLRAARPAPIDITVLFIALLWWLACAPS